MSQEFKLTRQPDWPYSEVCAPYSFALVGKGPNQLLLASCLTPRTNTGQADVRTRLVLHQLLYRLFLGRIRNNRRHLPEFGDYRYAWFPQSEMAEQLDLSEDQVKRGINRLVAGKIVVSLRTNRSEPCSYRLTDEAFMMAHALQSPVLKLKWALQRLDLTTIKGPDYEGKVKQVEDSISGYQRVFPKIVQTLNPKLDKWHRAEHATGRRLTPDESGLMDELVSTYSDSPVLQNG